MSAETFLAYWMCNVDGGSMPQDAPTSVDIVSLAFAVTAPVNGQDSLTLDYLAKYHSLDDIRAGAKAYWFGYQGQIDLYQQYAQLVGDQKVAIGVSNASGDQNTPFSAVGPLAAWDPPGSNKAGMMYWNLNSPPPSQTALWCATIAG